MVQPVLWDCFMLLNGPFGGTVASPLQASLLHFFKSPAAVGQNTTIFSITCQEREKIDQEVSTSWLSMKLDLLWYTVFALGDGV